MSNDYTAVTGKDESDFHAPRKSKEYIYSTTEPKTTDSKEFLEIAELAKETESAQIIKAIAGFSKTLGILDRLCVSKNYAYYIGNSSNPDEVNPLSKQQGDDDRHRFYVELSSSVAVLWSIKTEEPYGHWGYYGILIDGLAQEIFFEFAYGHQHGSYGGTIQLRDRMLQILHKIATGTL